MKTQRTIRSFEFMVRLIAIERAKNVVRKIDEKKFQINRFDGTWFFSAVTSRCLVQAEVRPSVGMATSSVNIIGRITIILKHKTRSG